MNASPYKKLTSKQRTLSGSTQAWLGSDHLLIVSSGRFSQRYQRFGLADIQSIVVTQKESRAVLQMVAIAAAMGWTLLFLQADSNFSRGFYVITGLMALALAVRDLALGPRCRCTIQTAVNRTTLAAITRVRVARKFLTALTPAIEAAQGSIAEEQWSAASAGSAALGTGFTFDQPAEDGAAAMQPPAIEKPRGYTSELLFGLLVVDSLLMWIGLRAVLNQAFGVVIMVYTAELVMSIFALVYARRKMTISAVLLVAALICIVVDPFVSSGPPVLHGFLKAVEQTRQGVALQMNFPVAMERANLYLSIGWRLLLGLFGLGACYLERDRKTQ